MGATGRRQMGDVVVLVPGILGSVLQQHGSDAWALSAGGVFRALRTMGGSLRGLALDGDDPDVDDLGDGVVATRLMPDVHLVPGLWKIDGYGTVAKSLHAAFELRPGENYFEFPYDWRRDNTVHGRRLARQAHVWLRDWRARSGNADAKLILIAHSMGGLVSRAYLELFEGWRDTRMLITFGTPYRGSLNALGMLHHGLRHGLGPVALDLSALLRSMTSVYQLLPIYPVVTSEDQPEARRVADVALPGVEQDRAAAALAFHRRIEQAVAAREGQPGGYRLHPIIGMGQPTDQGAVLDADRLRLTRELGGRDLAGDGTVPRVSAQPIDVVDAWEGVFTTAVHGSLQNTRSVLDHVVGLLSATDIDLRAYRDRHAGVVVDLPDVVQARDGLVVRGRLTGGRDDALQATVTDVDSGRLAWSGALAPGSEWMQATTPRLDPALYRVVVSSAEAATDDLVWAGE